MTPEELAAIKERAEAAERTPGHPAGALLEAWVRSARDVPALVAEVGRLQGLLDRPLRRASFHLACGHERQVFLLDGEDDPLHGLAFAVRCRTCNEIAMVRDIAFPEGAPS